MSHRRTIVTDFRLPDPSTIRTSIAGIKRQLEMTVDPQKRKHLKLIKKDLKLIQRVIAFQLYG